MEESRNKTVLLLCEKPSAAERVANALDMKNNPKRKQINGVPFYEAIRDSLRLIIVPALGHLYTVVPKVRDRSVFPVFEFQWVPRYAVERNAKNTQTWIEVISQLSKEATEFILATDYDVEGATLGAIILKYACGEKDKEAKRMKFSTLTTEELIKSYNELSDHIEFATIEAGTCRHFLDAMYGINLSRAMTIAANEWSGKYTVLSTGRVQGPTLKFLVNRERKIYTFVPVPYWSIKAKVDIDSSIYEVEYEQDVFERQDEAKTIVEQCRGKKGKITDIDVKKFIQEPPVPFDLGLLQTEAYAFFKYTPGKTLDIAERLYLDALISYPRTSSQKLPSTIGFREIFNSLSQRSEFQSLAISLLNFKRLIPKEGKKQDPAHPAIYPTGIMPEKPLDTQEMRLWNLIVKRFMAVFGEPALKQSVRILISVNGYNFFLRGKQVLEEGWMVYYKPFIRSEEILLPSLEQGHEIEVKEIILEDKFSKPPSRYNPSSLLKKMDDEGIGTKATRAGIIDTLYDRGYISGERVVVSELGFDVIDILSRYCPEVVSVNFTRELEQNMEAIQNSNEKMENALTKAISHLKPILIDIRNNQEAVGEELSEALKKARMQQNVVGDCPICSIGKLVILYSKRTGKRFIGCTSFFKGLCKASFPLPQKGILKSVHRSCRTCGWPIIQFEMQNKRPLVFCINPSCLAKEARDR